MGEIRIIDARMGRGKTSAAIEYMNNNADKRFIFVTPYLSEVGRICSLCDFEQPESDVHSKLTDMKSMIYRNKNISTTHSLLSLIDNETLKLLEERKYSIIIDEAIDVIEKVELTRKDFDLIVGSLCDVDEETNHVSWRDPDYDGKFIQCKELADAGNLYVVDSSMISVMDPKTIMAFDEVIIMTYMFNGQYQRAYLDFFGFKYTFGGIDSSDGYRFTSEPDDPPPVNFKELIHIVDDNKLNAVGDKRTALSKTWFSLRNRDHEDIKSMRKSMDTIYRNSNNFVGSDRRLWTTFKSDKDKLIGSKGRYSSSFLQMNSKATNAYRNRDVVLYMINRFADPNIKKFFASRGITIDEDTYALSEMLQFIWRSSIRDGRPITLYVPSKRMRNLLIGWIESNSKEIENV